MEQKYRLELIGITYNQIESGVYALILEQVGSNRRIPIIIGFPEAQAIECKLQEIKTPRPLTHDTMMNALGAFGISLKEVNIKKLPNGVFAADLHFTNGISEEVIDARSSDAIALAIRVGAPIYTSAEVLEEAGFDPKDKDRIKGPESPTIAKPVAKPSFTSTNRLSSMTMEQLSEAMMNAAEEENYEEAARIKLEIDKRKQQSDEK